MAVTEKRMLSPAMAMLLAGGTLIKGGAENGAERRIVPPRPTATAAASLAATAVSAAVLPELRVVHAVPGAGVVRIAPSEPTAMNWPLKKVIPRR